MGEIDGVIVTRLKVIPGSSGLVMHALKKAEVCFNGFGEAYFSTVEPLHTKGWKKHKEMILNLIVPVGIIRFVMFDSRVDSPTNGKVQVVEIGEQNYQRLTVPPGVWMAFTGVGNGINMLLNIASIQHDPEEAENLPIDNDFIPYKFN